MWIGADPHFQGEGQAVVMADTELIERQRADDELTERQKAAAILIARGHTNRDVARALRVSLRTAEGERSRLMHKLGFERRSELVHWALKRGLLY